MNRRTFLQSAAAASAAITILPGASLGARKVGPNDKLNIAMVGTWGRAFAHFGVMGQENIVALCDVNSEHLAEAAKKFPKARTYEDWRKMLEQKDIDAVVVCTTDHTHAFIANWAMNRDMHVYCEKPLANSVEEARVVRANYLSRKDKIATQCGTQRHELENFNRVRELVLDGAIGTLSDCYAWGDRKLKKGGYLPGDESPPAHINWDLWIGPSPYHPYNKGYFALGPGMNCLSWNMFWDFGSGQVGDMGSHTMDLVWNAIDPDLPTAIEAKGEPYNPEVTPVELETHFTLPANNWRPSVKVSWYQGGAMPRSPRNWVDLTKIDHGAMFKGSHGYIVCNFDSRLVIPFGKNADFASHYKPRKKEDLIPAMGNFQTQWIKACKGEGRTSCDFDYSGKMIETMLLGLVAYRAGKALEYDGKAGRITNDEAANALLKREYRPGWTLNG
jgi:predicted dehydrogenase